MGSSAVAQMWSLRIAVRRICAAHGGYFLERWDDGFADMLRPFIEVIVVLIKTAEVEVAGVVGKGGCGELVALAIVVEEQELMAIAVELGQGGFNVLGRVGHMKIWQAVERAIAEKCGEGKHVEIALEDGDIFRIMADGARAFRLGGEFVFPAAQFPAAGIGGETERIVLVVAAGEVIADFPVVCPCHIEGDPAVEQVLDEGGRFDPPNLVDLHFFSCRASPGGRWCCTY